jgi:hypothetical protein
MALLPAAPSPCYSPILAAFRPCPLSPVESLRAQLQLGLVPDLLYCEVSALRACRSPSCCLVSRLLLLCARALLLASLLASLSMDERSFRRCSSCRAALFLVVRPCVLQWMFVEPLRHVLFFARASYLLAAREAIFSSSSRRRLRRLASSRRGCSSIYVTPCVVVVPRVSKKSQASGEDGASSVIFIECATKKFV